MVFPHLKKNILGELAENAELGKSLTDKEIEVKMERVSVNWFVYINVAFFWNQNHYVSLSLTFKTDGQTLSDRLDVQLRRRDVAERSINREIEGVTNDLEVSRLFFFFATQYKYR